MMSINLPERAYCADVDYPMAVVGTAGRGIIIYQLEGGPKEFKKVESPLKYQHRCISIFRDKNKTPTGLSFEELMKEFLSTLIFISKTTKLIIYYL